MPSFCPQCGTALKPDAQFCEECGVPVGSTTSKPSPGFARESKNRVWLGFVVGGGAILLIGEVYFSLCRVGLIPINEPINYLSKPHNWCMRGKKLSRRVTSRHSDSTKPLRGIWTKSLYVILRPRWPYN
jgi:zinc-ribbon domain